LRAEEFSRKQNSVGASTSHGAHDDQIRAFRRELREKVAPISSSAGKETGKMRWQRADACAIQNSVN
jgi:hypothetical protein